MFTDFVSGNELLSKLRKMRMLADDDEDVAQASGPSKGQASQQPAWMRNLLERCTEWLGQLPNVSCAYTKILGLLLMTLLITDLRPARKTRN